MEPARTFQPPTLPQTITEALAYGLHVRRKKEKIMGMICCIHAVEESKIDSFRGDEEALFDYFEEAEDCMDFDKSWHAIHFMLTNSVWEGTEPLNFIVRGGSAIEGTDTGYGEVRLFSPADVVAIDSALSEITEEEFMKRFDGELMTKEDIYPTIWDRKEEETENKEYVLENFRSMKDYVHRTLAAGTHMIISIQ